MLHLLLGDGFAGEGEDSESMGGVLFEHLVVVFGYRGVPHNIEHHLW